MTKNNFETVRQAEQVAAKNIRKETFQWLQAAAEDGFTQKSKKICSRPLQQLSFNQFKKLIKESRRIAQAVNRRI